MFMLFQSWSQFVFVVYDHALNSDYIALNGRIHRQLWNRKKIWKELPWPKVMYHINRGQQIFQKSVSHPKILDAERITWRMFNTEGPQVFVATVQNLVAPGFVYPYQTDFCVCVCVCVCGWGGIDCMRKYSSI